MNHPSDHPQNSPDASVRTGDQSGYKAALRDLLERKGIPVAFLPPERWRNPRIPEISGYNDWEHYEALVHTRTPKETHGGEGCWWIIDDGAALTEETYAEWGGTFGEASHQVGINVTPVRCACGQYTGMTLRYRQSLSQTLLDLLGSPAPLLRF